MYERLGPVLRMVCVALAAVLIYQCSGLILRRNPLAKTSIPAVPTLAEATPAMGAGAGKNPVGADRNARIPGTNGGVAISDGATNQGGTNTIKVTTKTNDPAKSPATNHEPAVAAGSGTNSLIAKMPGTNGTEVVGKGSGKAGSTNGPVLAGSKTETNALASGPGSRKAGGTARSGRGGQPGGMPGVGPETPPEVKARIEKIYQSELFGPVNHPVPAALIGIAGDEVFLRASNGQTGNAKVGGEVGGLKVLKVGVNRVLVEEDGEQKELSIFAGFGGESLMSQRKEKSE